MVKTLSEKISPDNSDMKHIIITLPLIFLCTISFAQNIVTGIVLDAETNEPVIGAVVIESESKQTTTTDLDGKFSIKIIERNVYTLSISCLGYEDMVVKDANTKNLGTILMKSTKYLLSDAIVAGQTAIIRKTPVVSSNVYACDIEEKLGNQELTEAFKYTPGIHVNRQGGGWGDSEIFMRGFDNSNIAVMINGIPINDMETGTVYWSDWASLSDITSVMQAQRGIGASKVSVPSVGGTINIITKDTDSAFGGTVTTMLGNDGYNKESFSVNSGMIKGWALTLMGSHTSGNGYVQGTDFQVYSFFVNLAKRLNDHHQFCLTVFGAPHRQYSRMNGLTKSEWENVKSLYNVKNGDWTRYNPDYGFNSTGVRKSAEFSEYRKTFTSVNYTWNINENSVWSTNLYATIGNGGGYAGKADENIYTEYDWYSADYGNLNTKFRRKDGTYDYSAIEKINESSPNGSLMVMTQQDGRQLNLGLISTYTNRFIDCLDFSANIDIRRYKSAHTNRINDLLGGKYYIDPCRSEANPKNNPGATPEWITEHLGVGNVVYRDYDTNIMQEGGNVQLEYSGDNLTAFISGSLSNTTYWKYDRLYYEPLQARSKNISFLGGTVKGGINWNINMQNNIFVNSGYISRSPLFKSGAFMSPTSSNVTNILAKNEKSVTAEVGYCFHNPYVSVKASGYFTEWIDKSMTKKGKLSQQYYINMTGVNSRHIGLELEVKSTPAHWVELYAMLSVGDWTWDSDKVKGYAYNISGQAIDSDGNTTEPGSGNHAWALLNMKGVKVGGSAQTTATLDITFKPFKGFRVGAAYTLHDRNYAYYALSGSSLKLGKELFVNTPWKMPASGIMDLRLSYQFMFGKIKATLYAQMNNALNSRYIEKAWNPSNVSTSKKDITEDDVYMFYAIGRTWSTGLKFNF